MASTGPEPSDEELMLRVRAGDEAAFAMLYDRHQARTINFAWRITGSREDAQEVLQDAFRYLFTKAPEYEPKAKFTTLLFTVTRHLAVNRARRARRDAHASVEQALDVVDAGESPPAAVVRGERASRVQRALDRLPPLFREVLALRMVEDLPYADIAAVLGVPEGTVKSRLHNAIEQLRLIYQRT
ncbi:MAG: sigma-70 family RNA polymerase sigma factor [Planctomycetes bacterium]|nr:sigma-70 family RNA polymerase sigma factor [Planctomycetota bacterium]